MVQKKFKLVRKHKILFLVGITIAGLAAFGVANEFQKEHEVDASSNNNLADVLPSQMTTMTPSYVYSGAEVDSSVNSTQSLAITNNYFVVVQAHSVNQDSGWIVATDFANPSSTPAWTQSYNIGYGNAATWNSRTNQIVVADGYNRFFFNANNGNYVTTSTVSTSATGIAYNSVKNQYIQTYGNDGEILDSNFNLLMTFDAENRLVNQDAAYHNGYIYRVVWAGCDYLRNNGRTEDADYCDQYFGNNSNVIYQFDLNGDFTGAFYIEAGFGELESVAFGPDNAMYLLFNGKPDSSHYSVYKSDLNIIGKQYVSFANTSATKTYGDANFTNVATTTGDGVITYSSSNTNVASVNANTGEVTIRGAGSATITATAAATTNYNAASNSYTLTVNKANATVTFASSSVAKTYGDANFTNVATTTGDGAITYSSSNTNVASVNASTGEVTIRGAGGATITATAAATTNYSAASNSYTLTVNKANATVTFASSSVTKTYGDANFANTATTTGDGTITYSSSNANVASVNANTGEVTIRGAGSATITATAAATTNYSAASTNYSLTVNKIPSAKPEEVDEIKTGYYTDTLGTIEFSTEGLVWKNENAIIQLGQNVYEVYYTENNDAAHYTTETYEIVVDGIRRTYKVVSGDGQTYNIDTDSREYMSFTINADYDLFEAGGEVYLDNSFLSEDYYESGAGSTIINIDKNYLSTLTVGRHILEVYFGDGGVATADFVLEREEDEDVVAPDTVPQDTEITSDDSDDGAAVPNTGKNKESEPNDSFSPICVLPIVLTVLAVIVYVRKNSKKHRRFD